MKQQHKLLREQFRKEVFTRDKFKCKFCEVTTDLDAHHIIDRHEMPNGGYTKYNGITLCSKHHLDAEKHHITRGKEWVEGLHPLDLYEKISSSYEKAYEESWKLTVD
jgi:5-methylcytosine-specific restriction endonuclease McrA